MTTPMFNPQPNYSGVTIQIANPAVYAGQYGVNGTPVVQAGAYGVQPNCIPVNNSNYANYPQNGYTDSLRSGTFNNNQIPNNYLKDSSDKYNSNPIKNNENYPEAYPAQYYMNNYNYNENGKSKSAGKTANTETEHSNEHIAENNQFDSDKTTKNETNNLSENNLKKYENYTNSDKKTLNHSNTDSDIYNTNENNEVKESSNEHVNSYKIYAEKNGQKDNAMTKSQNIIGDLNERETELQEEKKNTKEQKIVALTDEYIKSLENYLNNPNDEIRLMASKEILTRLDEDKDRYNDAALNALLNKMLQDPNKLVRIASLSALSSQLASGNDYTVKLLHNIQSNPNADKEDVLQAADILLKMSAGVEVKNIPNPSVKEDKNSKG